METIYIKRGTTKGEVLNIACNHNRERVSFIDVALPQTWVDANRNKDLFFYVMDYYHNRIFGEPRHLAEIAEENGIKLIFLHAETMDLTPTWKEITPALILILAHGENKAKAIKDITPELMKMAAAADNWNAHTKKKEESI